MVIYANIVVNYQPQKKDINRVHITAGGNLINYPGELKTRTADLTASEILWNSFLGTDNDNYMCVYILKITSALSWTDLSTCAYHCLCSLSISYNNTTCEKTRGTDISMFKFVAPYKASYKREHW